MTEETFSALKDGWITAALILLFVVVYPILVVYVLGYLSRQSLARWAFELVAAILKISCPLLCFWLAHRIVRHFKGRKKLGAVLGLTVILLFLQWINASVFALVTSFLAMLPGS